VASVVRAVKIYQVVLLFYEDPSLSNSNMLFSSLDIEYNYAICSMNIFIYKMTADDPFS